MINAFGIITLIQKGSLKLFGLDDKIRFISTCIPKFGIQKLNEFLSDSYHLYILLDNYSMRKYLYCLFLSSSS